MNENSIEISNLQQPYTLQSSTLQQPSTPTVYYLGVLFTLGVVVGSMLGIIMTKRQ